MGSLNWFWCIWCLEQMLRDRHVSKNTVVIPPCRFAEHMPCFKCQPPGVLGCIFRPSSTDVSWRISCIGLGDWAERRCEGFSPRSNHFEAFWTTGAPGFHSEFLKNRCVVLMCPQTCSWRFFGNKHLLKWRLCFFIWKTCSRTKINEPQIPQKRFPRLLEHVFLTGYFWGVALIIG